MLYDRINGFKVDNNDARDPVRVRYADWVDKKVESTNVNFSIYSSLDCVIESRGTDGLWLL
jgi:hypothetical protein